MKHIYNYTTTNIYKPETSDLSKTSSTFLGTWGARVVDIPTICS